MEIEIKFNPWRGIRYGFLVGGLVAGILGAVCLGAGLIATGTGIGLIAGGFAVAGLAALATIGTHIYRRRQKKKWSS